MERTIRDVMARVHGLRNRIDQQPLQASRDQLNAIHIALKALLQRVQEQPRAILPPTRPAPPAAGAASGAGKVATPAQ